MNSVMQVLLSLPEFKTRFEIIILVFIITLFNEQAYTIFHLGRYYDTAEGVFQSASADPTGNFNAQMYVSNVHS